MLIDEINDLTEDQVRARLMALEVEFKMGSDRLLREVAVERVQTVAAGLRYGIPPVTLERLSGLSRQTIYRIVPETGEVRWFS